MASTRLSPIKPKNSVNTGKFVSHSEIQLTSRSVFEGYNEKLKVSDYRTDILIQEQLRSIKELQDALKKELDSCDDASTVNSKTIKKIKKKLDYNLICYEIICKLNRELNYARNVLNYAIKTKGNIQVARDRIKWLEERIETIILKKNEMTFPLYRKVLNDPKLKIRKQVHQEKERHASLTTASVSVDNLQLYSDIDAPGTLHSGSNIDAKHDFNIIMDDDEVSNLKDISAMTDSTESLIREVEEDMEQPILAPSRQTAPQSRALTSTFGRDVASATTRSDLGDYMYNYENAFLQNTNLMRFNVASKDNSSESDSDTETVTVRPELNSGRKRRDKELALNMYLKFKKKDKKEKVEEKQVAVEEVQRPKKPEKTKEENEAEFWTKPHNRYEWSSHLKILYDLDPTTYHQLALPLPDNYVTKDAIDMKLPWLEHKKHLDIEDIAYVETTKRIETMYNKICDFAEETTKKTKVNDFVPILITNADNVIRQSTEDRLTRLHTPASRHMDQKYMLTRDYLNERYLLNPKSPLGPKVLIPQTKTNHSITYPRTAKVFSNASTESFSVENGFVAPTRLVNQRNLKKESKIQLYRPRKLRQQQNFNGPSVNFLDGKKGDVESEMDMSNKEEVLKKILEASSWDKIKPISSPMFHDGPKFERIRFLLNVNLKSESVSEKRDAIKHLGLLKAADGAVIFTLKQILSNKSEEELLRLESAKSLVLLGVWQQNVFYFIVKYLKYGNVAVQLDILQTIIDGKNISYIERTIEGFSYLNRILEQLTGSRDEMVSLNASICLGKLGVSNSLGAIVTLKKVVDENTDWIKKSLALEVLVRHFNEKSRDTLLSVLHHIQHSPMWPSRVSAVKLLSILGPSVACTRESVETVYEILERRLSDDPVKEVRFDIGDTLKSLQLYKRVVDRMTNNLDSQDENVRAKAVAALDTLGVKKPKVIQMLIDMLELDGSIHVRTLIIKTLLKLAPNDSKVALAFDKLERNSTLFEIFKQLKAEMKIT